MSDKSWFYGVSQNRVRKGNEDFLILTRSLEKALEVFKKDQQGRSLYKVEVSQVEPLNVCPVCGNMVGKEE